jgi:hypothetical protein
MIEVGKQVTVRVRNTLWEHRHRYASGVVREFDTFSGVVLPLEKWQDPTQVFNLSTTMPHFPRRVLHYADVVSVDDSLVEYKTARLAQQPRHFTVQGSKGNVYTISVNGVHKSCTCPGFSFRRDCKHIRAI